MQETLTNKWVKTRKPHKCYGCLKTFPVGTEMRLIVSVNTEGINSTYLCQHCDNHSQNWTRDDWEATLPGNIGYWKNDQWYPEE